MALRVNDNGIDRDMTADEEAAYLANQEIAQAETKARADEAAAKAEARQAVLTKIGLTADEAAALFG
jgi:hypothetical protein